MRTIFLGGALLLCSIAFGQSTEFLQIENKIKEYMARGQWDEVMLLAPDLVIEEPTRGEGFYYTAAALLRLEQYDKASEYVAKAEALADSALKPKLEALKAAIQGGRQAEEVKTAALGEEKSGNGKKAADEWKKLWLLDKSKVEYALNAVELYIEQKDYVAALQVLTDPAMEKDTYARQLVARLNLTPKMRTINQYNVAMAEGKDRFALKDYAAAIAKFNQALELSSGDAEAKQMRSKAQDELAWQNTLKTNTIEAFEAYASGSTLKQHRDEALETVKSALIFYGEKYAKEDNLQQMEYYLNKYLNEYPSGADVDKAKNILCATYYQNGRKAAAVKTAYSQEQAIGFYTKVNSLCSSGYSLAGPLKTARRLKTRYGRPNRGYLSYVYDSITPIGLSIGTINNRKIGMYLTARLNGDFVTDAAYYTVDNSGKLDGNVYDDIRFNHNVRRGDADIVLGFTKKIVYPLWIYAGGGITLHKEWWEMDSYSDNGTYNETEWVKNRDEVRQSAIADAGVIIDLGGLHLRGGFKTSDFKTMLYSVGIGFSWKRN